MEIKVSAVKCLECKDTIYSRANHDFHRCTCGLIFVDGGNWSNEKLDEGISICGYRRIGGEQHKFKRLVITLTKFASLQEAKQALYDDWNKRKGVYGIIKNK